MTGRDNRDAIDFAREPIGKLFRQMLLPTLIGMLSIVVLNITDGAFVGHGAGAESLAAVNIAAPIFNILGGIGIMFGIGGSVIASIHLSHNDVKAARINVTQALLGGFIITLCLSILMLSDLAGTCRLFGSSVTLAPLASRYLLWISVGAPLMIFHMSGNLLIRVDGSPKFAMATSLVGSGLNIFLDYLFIFPFGWGLEGAAKATCISFCIAGGMVLWYFVFRSKTLRLYHLKFTPKSFRLILRDIGYQVRLGFSAMLGEVAVSGAVITGNYVFVRYLGDDGVAAYSVACYCFPVIFMMANAIVQSAQPIVSFAYGSGSWDRLRESRLLMFRWATGAGLISGAFLYLCAPYIAMLFLKTNEPSFLICVDGLPYFGFGVLFITLNIVAIGYLQSTEQSMKATILTLLRGFLIVIPCFILLPHWIGNVGMWLAIPFSEFMTSVAVFCNLNSLRKTQTN